MTARDKVLKVLSEERAGLDAIMSVLHTRLHEHVNRAVQMLCDSMMIAITGVGKSGYVARKAASTFTTTSMPAVFMSPQDAAHGEMAFLDMVDVLIVVSWSGKSRELDPMIDYCKHGGPKIIAVTGAASSRLVEAADVVLRLPHRDEVTPTVTSTMSLALLDAIAIAVMESLGITEGDIKTWHPGGGND